MLIFWNLFLSSRDPINVELVEVVLRAFCVAGLYDEVLLLKSINLTVVPLILLTIQCQNVYKDIRTKVKVTDSMFDSYLQAVLKSMRYIPAEEVSVP